MGALSAPPRWRWRSPACRIKKGGVQAAMDYLVGAHAGATKQAAE